jgi:hypothetical protein
LATEVNPFQGLAIGYSGNIPAFPLEFMLDLPAEKRDFCSFLKKRKTP